MTRSMTMILAGGTAAVALAISGCSAGMNAQTADQVAAVPGVNLTATAPGGQGTVSVRDVVVAYPGVEGYPAGVSAPLQIRIFNDSPADVEVTISSPAGTVRLVGGKSTASPSAAAESPAASPTAAATTSPDASPTASPDASPSEAPSPKPSPTPATSGPAKVTIPTGGYIILDPTVGGQYAEITGLKERLLTGESVVVKFDFGNGTVIETPVPVTVPLSAYPREHAKFEESEGH